MKRGRPKKRTASDSEIRENIRKNIETLMIRKGFTQSTLARELGVHRSAISEWLTGNATPDVERIAELCQVFDCSVSEMFAAPQVDLSRVLPIVSQYEELSPEERVECKKLIKKADATARKANAEASISNDAEPDSPKKRTEK